MPTLTCVKRPEGGVAPPNALMPQQAMLPSVLRAQLYNPPALTCATVPGSSSTADGLVEVLSRGSVIVCSVQPTISVARISRGMQRRSITTSRSAVGRLGARALTLISSHACQREESVVDPRLSGGARNG